MEDVAVTVPSFTEEWRLAHGPRQWARAVGFVTVDLDSGLGQKKDVRMLRYIQEVNTTTRSCALWDLEEDTEYIVHVQSISMGGSSPPSDPVSFRTPRESEKLASTGPGR
ncbi:unnamed protein product [Coregonus sp. 'balchen']|nr:unnamed protein product [Coregonus sp. 'balchen']